MKRTRAIKKLDCGHFLTLAAFRKGYRNHCKSCSMRRWVKRNRASWRTYQRIYRRAYRAAGGA